MDYNNYFAGKRVLVTGHTGFKGSWLTMMLNILGSKVIGYSLDPKNLYDNFNVLNLGNSIIDVRGDIRDYGKLKSIIDQYKPEIIFHLAAQPLVRLSYEIPRDTFEVNLMGVVNILEAFRNSEESKTLVMITSDKVYENKEWVWSYRENDQLGGYDPYSASKGASEIVCSAYQRSFFNPDSYEKHGKIIATVRAGNVIGGGDWSRDRLIPDVIKSIEGNIPINIRNPGSIRPWQHVLDPLHGYLLLASKLHFKPKIFSGPWNFGPNKPQNTTVKELVNLIIDYYGKGELKINKQNMSVHESRFLSLDNSKATAYLGWTPKLTIEDAASFTVQWYKSYKTNHISNITKKQIETFLNIKNEG